MNFKKISIYTFLLVLIFSSTINFFNDNNILNSSKSIINLVLDILLIITGIISLPIKEKIINITLMIFFIFIIISLIINSEPTNTTIFLNGIREFTPYLLIPIFLKNIFYSSYRDILVRKFNIFIHIFLIIQIPVSLLQFIQKGAGDAVGGTLGSGYSGILTFTIYLSTFYLMLQNFNPNYIGKCLLKKSYLFIFWIPTFINETKISFILILLFFILLNEIKIKNILKLLTLSITLIPFAFIFDTAYEKTTGNSYLKEILNEDFVEEYLLSDDDKYEDIPRFRKVVIFVSTFDVKDVLIGKGLGHFKGGSTLELTPFATKYQWLLAGSRPMIFFLLVQVGILGTILLIAYWIFLSIPYVKRKYRVKNYSNLIIYITICYIIIMLYNDSLRNQFFCLIIIYILVFATSPSEPIKLSVVNKLIENKKRRQLNE